MALPRLGPSLVGRIVAARAQAPFRSVDDLDARVRGLGPATIKALRPHLRIDPTASPGRRPLAFDGSFHGPSRSLNGSTCQISSWRPPIEPAGDQPKAIDELTQGLRDGHRHQTLLGVTGSGKTFTMANVIAQMSRPRSSCRTTRPSRRSSTASSRSFFPHNAVRYFVSYYDYYQPEAYIPQRDIYIEKDASINDEIERLRLAATSALVSRNDVIVVASVSCIYGLGSPRTTAR